MKNNNTPHTTRSPRLLLLLVLAALPLCSDAQSRIVEKNEVANCKWVENLEASTGYGKRISWMSDAKFMLLREADKIGATHVVIKRYFPIGSFNGLVRASAYQCP